MCTTYYVGFWNTIFGGDDIETDDMNWKQCREVIFIMEECSTQFKFNETTESELNFGQCYSLFLRKCKDRGNWNH